MRASLFLFTILMLANIKHKAVCQYQDLNLFQQTNNDNELIKLSNQNHNNKLIQRKSHKFDSDDDPVKEFTDEEILKLLEVLENDKEASFDDEKYPIPDYIIPNREKKNKNYNSHVIENPNYLDDTQSEAIDDRHKNHDLFDNSNSDSLTQDVTNVDSSKLKDTCSSRMKYEPNVILDSKSSVAKGAKLISIEYISQTSASSRLNSLQDNCMKKCCNNKQCDTGLLSMKLGEEGYRCYLFKCNENCLFVKHNDYVVLRMKSPEQLEKSIDLNSSSSSKIEISTGHKDTNTPCHKQYEFTCTKSGLCIPIYDVCNSFFDCEDKSDEINCNSSTIIETSSTTAKIQETTTIVQDDPSLIVPNGNDMYKPSKQDLANLKDLSLEGGESKKPSKNNDEKSGRKKTKNGENKLTNEDYLDLLVVDKDQLNTNEQTDDEDETIAELANEIFKEEENKKLDNLNEASDDSGDLDYDEYKLLKKQAEIIEHLKELEKLDEMSNGERKKILFESSKDFLDSFMKPSVLSSSKTPNYISKTTTNRAYPTNSKTKSNKPPNIIFHDNHNVEINNRNEQMNNQDITIANNQNLKISNFLPDDKIYFEDKEKALTPTASKTTAIILLILGISLVIALFVYLILSTKYVSKRIKWIKHLREKRMLTLKPIT